MPSKSTIDASAFLDAVAPDIRPFVEELHARMLEAGCALRIKEAKSGYMVSYSAPRTKKALANFVFRKTGLLIRLYADGVAAYQQLLDTLPEALRSCIVKAPDCKRLAQTGDCSSRCAMGYAFMMQDTPYQKCRYSAFLLPVTQAHAPHIRALLAAELDWRQAQQA